MAERIPLRENFGERIAAFLLLSLMLPTLITVAMIVRFFGGEPVLVKDQYARCGLVRQSLRFRTSGSGGKAFRQAGWFLRLWKIDELPALWSVVRGEVRLSDLNLSVR